MHIYLSNKGWKFCMSEIFCKYTPFNFFKSVDYDFVSFRVPIKIFREILNIIQCTSIMSTSLWMNSHIFSLPFNFCWFSIVNFSNEILIFIKKYAIQNLKIKTTLAIFNKLYFLNNKINISFLAFCHKYVVTIPSVKY